MKHKNKFIHCACVPALVFFFAFAGLLRAQNNASCIDCTPALQYPYTFNFGSLAYPTTEHQNWHDTSAFGNMAVAKPWSFTAPLGETARALCFDGAKYSAPEDEDFPAMYSRCMSMKKAKSYILKFTVQTAIGGLGLKIGLAHKTKSGKYVYSSDNGCGQVLFTTLLSGGTSNFSIPINQVPFDSIFAIAFQMSGSGIQTKVYFKNIEIIQNSSVDLSLAKPYALQSSCDLGTSEKISFILKNKGQEISSRVRAHYVVDHQTVKSETFAVHVLPGKDTLLEFSETVDLSAKKEYQLSIFIDKEVQDGNPVNDSLNKIILHNYQDVIQAPLQNILSIQNQAYWSMGSEYFSENGTWVITNTGEDTYAHIKTNTSHNGQWLSSPCIEMEKDKVYKISFLYLAERADLPEKMSLYVLEKIGGSELPIWTREGFVNTKHQGAIAYFTPKKNGIYHLAFFANSADFSEGIKIQSVSVDTLSRQFPPFSEDFLLDEATTFLGIADVNNDGNTWTVENTNAYNSASAIQLKMGAAYATTLNDIFRTKPVFLTKDTAYRVYFAKKSSVSENQAVNIYFSSLPNYKYLHQAEFFRIDTIQGNNYQISSFVFTPSSSDNYYLFFEKKTQNFTTNNIISIDNLMIKKESLSRDSLVRVQKINIPSSATDGDKNAILTLDIKNFSMASYPINAVKIYYQVNKNTPVMYSYTGSLKPYEYKSVSLNAYPVDFSTDTIFEIKTWVQYTTSQQSDTTVVWVKTSKNAVLPFIEHFEDSFSLGDWRIINSSSQINTWHFIHDNPDGSFMPPSYAVCKPSVSQNLEEYLASPGMQLHKDTTYFLSFYYAAGETLKSVKDKLSIVYSNKNRDKENFVYSLMSIPDIANTNYVKVSKYFRVPATGRYYIAFKAESPAYSSGIRLDEVYIMDSLSSLKTNIKIDPFKLPMGGSCFLTDKEEVSVKITNKGYFEVSEYYIKYQIGRSDVYCDTLRFKLSSDQSITYTLNKKWDLSAPGKDSIRVWIDMPKEINRGDDSTQWIVIEHRLADTQIPMTNSFEETDAYWTYYDRYGQNAWIVQKGQDAYQGERYVAHVNNSKNENSDSWLFSPCMDMEKNKTYTLSFFAKSLSSTQAEQLAVHFLDTINPKVLGTLLPNKVFSNIYNTTYQRFDVFFTPSQTKAYTVAFRSLTGVSGEQLFIDQVSLSPFDSAYDISVLSINSPCSGVLGEKESLSVRLDNKGPFAAKNVKISAQIGEKLMNSTVASIPARGFVDFIFPEKLDMQKPGEYKLQVFVDYPTDQNRSNDTLSLRVISEAMNWGLLSFENPTHPPYTATEKVKVLLKKDGKTDMGFIVSLKLNGEFVLADTLAVWPNAATHVFSKTLDMSTAGTYAVQAEILSVKDTFENDNILSKTFVNKGNNVKILAINKPLTTSKTYTSSEILEISLQNTGDYPINKLPIEYRINGILLGTDTLSELLPGLTGTHRFNQTIDLSDFGNYRIEVKALLEGDLYPADNTVLIEINHLSETADVALLSLEAPVHPPFSAVETISVQVQNRGTETLQGIPVFLELNAQKYSEQIPTLYADQTLTYHFPTLFNMQENKKYSLLIYTALKGDTDQTNDTIRKNFQALSIEPNKADKFLIYPNPAGDFVTVTAPSLIDKLEIYHLNGHRVLFLSKLPSPYKVSLSALPAGTYYIRLFSAGVQENKIFIKK